MDTTFKKNPNGTNFLSLRGDYWLSFQPNAGGDIALFRGDTPQETAIVVPRVHPDGKYPDGNNFFILNGDHREAYTNCKTLEECMNYFYSHPELKSSWSN